MKLGSSTVAKVVSLSALACLAAACGKANSIATLPAAVVNDSCSSHARADDCTADTANGCAWLALGAACPAGASCPAGVCITPDPCGSIADPTQCQADARCAWSAPDPASPMPLLCPVGRDCGAGGYCHARDVSGGGCTCVQPLVCPAGADCPAVQCDCSAGSPPTGGGTGGGGTCTCTCPACAPGQTCPPCACDCGGGGGGGGTGGSTCGGGGVAGPGTCTCACPVCTGPSCPPCACGCGDGAVGVAPAGTTGTGSAEPVNTTMFGAAQATSPPAVCNCPVCPANTACAPCECGSNPPPPDPVPADPCAGFTDAVSCAADTAEGCGWIELGLACAVNAPCKTGVCTQTKSVPGSGGGGCGCACPACAPGEACPPCSCNCCAAPPPTGAAGSSTTHN